MGVKYKKIKRAKKSPFEMLNNYFENFAKELKKLPKETMDRVAKKALEEAIKAPAEDMAKEFRDIHKGTGATYKDFKVTKPRKGNVAGNYETKAEYLRRGTTGRGFVALFFDYGVPHLQGSNASAKSKQSKNFIGRAFGTIDNPQRAKEIQDILERVLKEELAKIQNEIIEKV